jgi:chromate transport protein ChrA
MFLPVGFNWVEEGSFFYTNIDIDRAFNWVQIIIVLASSILLFKTKIKSPWYIAIAILFGVLL